MSEYKLVDTHAHLDDGRFSKDLEQVVKRAKDTGVSSIITVGCDNLTSKRSIELANTYDGVYATCGYHPHEAKLAGPGELRQIEKLASSEKVVAIGEIGLDYHYDHSPRDVQKHIFAQQLDMAIRIGLPVIVHDREAHGDTMDVLQKRFSGTNIEYPGVLHCFSGSYEMALACIDMGFFISFAGPLTFNNAKRLKSIGSCIRLDRVLLETDCPYLAPQPKRGRRNEPSYIKYIARELASLVSLPVEEIAKITTENAKRLFKI